uniref:Iron hydrogenase large subunit C-terminal domain-containing protein n=1 Tax=Ditylenchus dipsaci TaxID=166011 RepID=A0A915DKB3_9BILA
MVGAQLRTEQKTKDLEVTTIVTDCNEPIRIAKLYGCFKNIQNAVQKLKRKRLQLDFVEVMACPTGCANGGGQIRGENTEQRTAITQNVIAAYQQLIHPQDALDLELRALQQEWSQLEPDYKNSLLTEYHSLQNDNNNLLKTSIPTW